MANDRISQLPVEVALQPTDAKARFSQDPVEVVLQPTDAKARFSQVAIEVVIGPVDHGVARRAPLRIGRGSASW